MTYLLIPVMVTLIVAAIIFGPDPYSQSSGLWLVAALVGMILLLLLIAVAA